LTIRGFGLPSVAADAAKLAALKQFIGKGLAAAALMPTIAKVFSFDEIAAAQKLVNRSEK
jgi:hypothetical protein